MEADIRELLESWPYDMEESSRNFRLITGSDGRLLIQVREPLGIQQMEYTGRPDGQRPHGRVSWLAYYRELQNGNPLFGLDDPDCSNLMREGILYYQRYLILFQMEDWEAVAEDTARNLSHFDFVKEFARDKDNSTLIEQYRPYVMRINAVARANLHWKEGEYDRALTLLRRTILAIKTLESVPTQVFNLERDRSVNHLEEVVKEFEGRQPESLIERIRREQREAILREDFDAAAKLRDELRRLEGDTARKN